MAAPTHGMDVQQVKRLGADLQASARALEGVLTRLDRLVLGAHWVGPDGARFRQQWWPAHKRNLARVAQDLHGFGQSALNNAADQERVSAAEGGGGGGTAGPTPRNSVQLPAFLGGAVVGGAQLAQFYRKLGTYERTGVGPPVMARRFPELDWALTAGKGELASIRGASPAEQLRWWADLGRERQKALILAYPGGVLQLDGLPADARSAATHQHRLQTREATAQFVSREGRSYFVDLKAVSVEGTVTAEVTEYRNGAVVKLAIDGDLGKEFGNGSAKAGASVGAGAEVTYSFTSPQEAKAFLSSLETNLREGRIDMALEHLGSVDPTSTDLSVSLEGQASLKVGGVAAEINGSATATYNVQAGTTTAELALGGGASLAGVGGDLTSRLAVVFDEHGNATSATIAGSASASTGVGVDAFVESLSGEKLAGASASVAAGSEIGYAATVDTTDPRVRAELARLLADPFDVAAQRRLFELADATVTVDAITDSESRQEVLGSGVSSSSHTAANVVTYAKPPGGQWYRVDGKN